ncbi:MacB family efflux pump subunit [Rhizobium wuzhouense]|uniref:Pyoverdine export ATP-binding/permease protein PvdT n=1 Tax=Rhizobium wuzhouense TaxID=1986026 RepID=A0ABX5NS92_9HYPH|nr:MacB family efflux pump subunit [Rhizobium wuzhouense]PYB74209.1 macrolide ABC transporter permease/ATP-binding protein MacB [Rhizobium wuzhouense]
MSALLELSGVTRSYRNGDETVTALAGIDLIIEAGELVAIVGTSGSGKSTLMNILGCLDQPSSGDYRIGGRSVSGLSANELASMRRENFGFIFQRYHLLPSMTAADNVAMPAVYAGTDGATRAARAGQLLQRLGLGERVGHRPGQLSGGQQQRVSIARALMNGGRIILADEPTGALDSASGETVLEVLRELHTEGHTVIIVTHDMQVAEKADRIIEIRDGRVLADRRVRETVRETPLPDIATSETPSWFSGLVARFSDAFPMALRSMAAQRTRTFLTMFGIVIGIAAVVAVVGMGEGSRRRVLAQISELGASTLTIFPGRGWTDEKAGSITSLVLSDASVLSAQPYVAGVTPLVTTTARARSDQTSLNATINGVGAEYFAINGIRFVSGHNFPQDSMERRGQYAILDDRTASALFPRGDAPIGKIVMLDRMPVTVTGIVARPRSAAADKSLQVYIPHTSAAGRLLAASTSLAALSVRVAEGRDTAVAERAIVSLLERRHGTKDFFVFNSDQMRRTMESASQTLAVLISSVAVISLVVGGVGVMNIMLVSVTERTKEIGLRMAVGARRLDIMLQFLIEAIVICVAGSLVGVGLALALAALLGGAEGEMPMVISVHAILGACASAFLIGLLFGFLPARGASRLDPVDALSRE